jgi:hypothetical protein
VVTRVDGSPQPLVAVVTPVYNGADSLAACLKSVGAQTYTNWIHLVVNNASTDTTRQIAESFAAKEPRVMVLSFRECLPMFENFNRALAAVPSGAIYLKQLHADDTIHPDCLTTMVAAAERDPDVALVVSRFYLGSVPSSRNAPARAVRLSGRTVAREALLGTSNILGTPSVSLLRIERLVGWPVLFRAGTFPPGHPARPPHNQGDKESCFDTLEQSDVVYLPELLVTLREEALSATGFARRVSGWHATRLDLLLRRGAQFMDESTLRTGIRRTALRWSRALAWRYLKQSVRPEPEFLLYQRLCLDNLIPRLREAGHTSEATMLACFHPGPGHSSSSPERAVGATDRSTPTLTR